MTESEMIRSYYLLCMPSQLCSHTEADRPYLAIALKSTFLIKSDSELNAIHQQTDGKQTSKTEKTPQSYFHYKDLKG